MVDFEKQFVRPGCAASEIDGARARYASVFRQVYGWMCAGLALSGVVAWYTASSGLWEKVLVGPGLMACIFVELALVIALTAAIGKLPYAVACLMFAGYAALNGLTLSVVLVAYDIALVEKAFFVSAGMFGGLALWGTVTKGDLSGIGSFCGMALWGLVIALVVNMFLRSSGLDYALSFVGIIVFTGLTMFDAQKVRRLAEAQGLDDEAVRKAGVIGALALYLDFINLFLHILRFMGRKR